jgi:hypothetical protein
VISFHYDQKHIGKGEYYSRDFVRVETDDPLRIANCVRQFAWSTIAFQGGIRQQKFFVASNWLGLDFDDPDFTLSQAVENKFCDLIHVIGTTRSHQKPKGGITCDRFRVILKLEDTITDLATYRATAAHWVDHWEADEKCKDGARYFWPCTEIVSVCDDGDTIEVIKPKERMEFRESELVEDGVLSYFAQWALLNVIPIGERNISCWRLGCDLAKAGYSLEDAVKLVLDSPTYRSGVTPALHKEIYDAVSRGWDKVVRERIIA